LLQHFATIRHHTDLAYNIVSGIAFEIIAQVPDGT